MYDFCIQGVVKKPTQPPNKLKRQNNNNTQTFMVHSLTE